MSEKNKNTQMIPDQAPTVSFDINVGRRIPHGESIDIDYDELMQIAKEKLTTEELADLTIDIKDKNADKWAFSLASEDANAKLELPLKGVNDMYPYAVSLYTDRLHNTSNFDEETLAGRVGDTSDLLLRKPFKAMEEDPLVSGLLIANPAVALAMRGLAGQTKSDKRAEKFAQQNGKHAPFSVPSLRPYAGRHRKD